MRKILIILAALLTLTSAALAQEEYIGRMRVVNCSEWVSLRAKPDADAKRVLKVPLGAVVENCSYRTEEYIYAEYDGRSGYIMAQYLQPAATRDQYIGDLRVANCNDYVNLRAEPDTSSKRLAKVPLGARFENCTAAENGFIHGSYQGTQGYISVEYLEAVKDNSPDQLLAQCRVELAAQGKLCGAALISRSLGGDWLLGQESARLASALDGLPKAWRELAAAIPANRIIEVPGGRELYLIIPMDESAAILINQLTPGENGAPARFSCVLLSCKGGEPFLLRCNALEAEDGSLYDCEVNITDSAGAGLTWNPRLAGDVMVTDAVGAGVLDFSDKLAE